MPDYTVYRGAAGTYVATLTMPDLAQAQLNIEPGDVLVEGDFGPMTWWNGLGVQNLPPKPEDWLVWDGSAWVDPRDPAQRETDLHLARYATNAEQRGVLLGLAQLGAYPVAELASDATYFPATLEAYLSTLTPADHDAVKAALKYEPMIWRLHPHLIGDQATGIEGFVPWLSAERGVTISPEDLDAVFGVIAPPPIYVPS